MKISIIFHRCWLCAASRGFPVRCRVEAVDTEIVIDGITVCPGDLVYARRE